MSIHIVKTNYSKALRECHPDAVLKTQIYTDIFSEGSVEVVEGGTLGLVILGYLPFYIGEECHEKIQDVYLKAFKIAAQYECRSILISIPYCGNAYAPIRKLLGIAIRASYEALVSKIFRADIYVVLEMLQREKIMEFLPKIEKMHIPVSHTDKSDYECADMAFTMSFVTQNVNSAGIKEVVHVPDSLHKALMRADWETIYYYDEDNPHEPTASQILAKHMLDNCYKKDRIYSKLEYYVGRTTVYSYLKADYPKRPSKDPLVYISLAMGLSLEQTIEILHAAGWKLDGTDPIDMTYVAAFEERADVCEMVSWLDVEGMLDAAKRRDGIKFVTDKEIEEEDLKE